MPAQGILSSQTWAGKELRLADIPIHTTQFHRDFDKLRLFAGPLRLITVLSMPTSGFPKHSGMRTAIRYSPYLFWVDMTLAVQDVAWRIRGSKFVSALCSLITIDHLIGVRSGNLTSSWSSIDAFAKSCVSLDLLLFLEEFSMSGMLSWKVMQLAVDRISLVERSNHLFPGEKYDSLI